MTARRWILTAISFLFAIVVSIAIIQSSWTEDDARVILPVWGHVACFGAAFFELLTRSIKIRLSAAALHIPLDVRTSLRVSLGATSAAPSRPRGPAPSRRASSSFARLVSRSPTRS